MAEGSHSLTSETSAGAGPLREKRFTVEEFVRMGELGLLPEPGRHELWDGRIMMAPPAGSPHMDRERRIVRALILALHASGLDDRFGVFTGGGLQIGELNLRAPDVIVGRLPFDTSRRLTGEGVALLIEIAVSSLADDLVEKRGKYAGGGVPEYWVIDVEGARLHCFTSPVAGDYRDHVEFASGASVSPVFAPSLAFAVADLV
jgi:Uma2 family endonuclease